MTKRSTRVAWLMMHLPKAPAPGATVADLEASFRSEGARVGTNVVYKALQDILEVLGPGFLEVDEPVPGRAYRWRLAENAELNLPGQSLPVALALKVLDRDGRQLLPPAVVDELAPLTRQAERVIA